MASNFNSNFFFVSATVIPVLYIALLVQFPLIDRATKQLSEWGDMVDPPETGIPMWQFVLRVILEVIIRSCNLLLAVVGALIIALSLGGEILALLAMYRQSAAPNTPRGVLAIVIALLIATLLIPAWITILAIFRYFLIVIPKTFRDRVKNWLRKSWKALSNAEPPSEESSKTRDR
ncbi:MAG TPA: hypothetical protein VGZ22_26905 [Isosphaeraceae bacterium]|jgi:hypothetical protein|nr:hypothetical protein [Isosphaeraceae bacterium]